MDLIKSTLGNVKHSLIGQSQYNFHLNLEDKKKVLNHIEYGVTPLFLNYTKLKRLIAVLGSIPYSTK